jgi:hypothetical protein
VPRTEAYLTLPAMSLGLITRNTVAFYRTSNTNKPSIGTKSQQLRFGKSLDRRSLSSFSEIIFDTELTIRITVSLTLEKEHDRGSI